MLAHTTNHSRGGLGNVGKPVSKIGFLSEFDYDMEILPMPEACALSLGFLRNLPIGSGTAEISCGHLPRTFFYVSPHCQILQL